MSFWRQKGTVLTLGILAVMGIAISIYLTLTHLSSGVALVCPPISGIDCSTVVNSAYGYVPGTTIPITVPGLLWFVALGGLALAIALQPQRQLWRTLLLILTVLGLFTALYLVYVEIVLLQQICMWCTILHIFIFIAFIIAIMERQPVYDEEDEDLEGFEKE